LVSAADGIFNGFNKESVFLMHMLGLSLANLQCYKI